jgi:O-antigen/teichoic acid export membrane protein
MSTVVTSVARASGTKIPSLTTNFAWTLGGSAIYTGCQWGILAVLAKKGSSAVVGVFALGLAISAPVFMFTNLQLRAVQATDAQSQYRFAEYFTLRSVSILLGLVFIGIFCLSSGYDRETLVVIACISIAKAFESWSDVIAGLLQKHERLDLASRALSLRGALSLGIFAAVFAKTHSLSRACASLAIVWAGVVCAYDMRLARRSLTKEEVFLSGRWSRIWQLIKTSIPLGVVMTLVSLNVNLPRYILQHSLGSEQLGIFASLAYLVTAANLLIFALGQSASARLSRMFAENELDQFRSVVLKLVLFGAVIGAGCTIAAFVCGRPILTMLYGPVYADHQGLLLVLAITAGIGAIGSFLGFAVTAAQSFRPQVPVIAAMTATTLLLSWILIQKLGLIGAGIALLASSLVQLVGFAAVMHLALRRQIPTA